MKTLITIRHNQINRANKLIQSRFAGTSIVGFPMNGGHVVRRGFILGDAPASDVLSALNEAGISASITG